MLTPPSLMISSNLDQTLIFVFFYFSGFFLISCGILFKIMKLVYCVFWTWKSLYYLSIFTNGFGQNSPPDPPLMISGWNHQCPEVWTIGTHPLSLGILDVALVERQVIGILQFGSLRTLVIDSQVRGHKVVGVTTVQRGHLELYSGTNARPGWRQGLLREQFTELIVPWGNTTPGPPTHPSLLLVLFLNMEVNRGMMHVWCYFRELMLLWHPEETNQSISTFNLS